MFGAIAGDIIGSPYEFENTKDFDFPLFNEYSTYTDDTVLTVATAEHLLCGVSYVEAYQSYGRNYASVGFGAAFKEWLELDTPEPYNSWGNGSAMRVSPIGFAANSILEAARWAEESAEVTHNHPEGIKGAQATAVAIYLAYKAGASKGDIKSYIEKEFGYDLNQSLKSIQPTYSSHFYVSCQRSVPVAIRAFLESNDFVDAIRRSVWVGGDSDTIAAICGGIAEAYYKGIPEEIETEIRNRWPDELTGIIDNFRARFMDVV